MLWVRHPIHAVSEPNEILAGGVRGLLYRQRLVDFCNLFTFSNSLDFYINTYLTSIDTNPRSTFPSGPKIPGDKGVLLQRNTRTRSGGSNSNYAHFCPLFAQLMDQVKNKAGVDVVNNMMYKALGILFKLNNENKNDNKEGADIPPQSAPPSSTV